MITSHVSSLHSGAFATPQLLRVPRGVSVRVMSHVAILGAYLGREQVPRYAKGGARRHLGTLQLH
jgi:hypothetical protein